MLTYWLMFLLPALVSVLGPAAPQPPSRQLESSWLFVGLLLALLIGLRYQVGGDWGGYRVHYLDMFGVSMEEAAEKPDPGYYLLVWFSTQVGGDVYLVNLVFGIVFSWGLVSFCRQQPRPWLALTVAVPYMVVVVAMGYSRQGVALGLVMLGMVELARQNTLRFVGYVVLAATFHKSAVLLVPLAVLSAPRGRLWTALWVGIAAVLLYWALLADNLDNLVTNYIEAEYQSDGAGVRVAMNALPAALLLHLRKRFVWEPAERNLWTMMAVASLLTVVALVLSPSSTAVDRVALYLIPVQLYVFARLPDLLGRDGRQHSWVLVVVFFYGLAQFVWLNFATFALYWLPYQFYPLT